MIPLFKVRMSKLALSSVPNTLASGYIGQGPKVEVFEDALQFTLNSEVRPVTLNSCTAALDLALHLIGVGPGDVVISTPQTCFASNSVILNRGAQIEWADIHPITGLIDPIDVARIVERRPRGSVRAIMAVDWAGRICDYKALKSWGIPVIEDAAHVWDAGGTDRERGDYICYSFQAIKFLTTGDGGALIPPADKEEEARILRWYGLDRTKGESFRCTQNITRVGFKYHMNDIAATIGLANLPEAADSEMAHINNAMTLTKELSDCDYIITPPSYGYCSYWLYTIITKGIDRDDFSNYLTENGIGNSQVHFRNDMYDVTKFYKKKHMLGLDKFSETQLNIPVGWWLNKIDLAKIIDVIKTYK